MQHMERLGYSMKPLVTPNLRDALSQISFLRIVTPEEVRPEDEEDTEDHGGPSPEPEV